MFLYVWILIAADGIVASAAVHAGSRPHQPCVKQFHRCKVHIAQGGHTHYPTNAMSVADEALMLNRKGKFFYGPAVEILNEENISYSFDVQVLVDELHYQGRSVRSIVPVALREETAV